MKSSKATLSVFVLIWGIVSLESVYSRKFPNVDPRVARNLKFGRTNIMVTLANSTKVILAPFLAGEETYENREDLLNAVTAALQAHAALTQAPVLQALASLPGFSLTSFWISNQIFLRNVDTVVVTLLQNMPAIARIDPDRLFHLTSSKPTFHDVVESDRRQETVMAGQWGVNKIEAPAVWSLGYSGQGVRVGGIDTGVRGSHASFSSRYVGAYGWFDPSGHTSTPNDQNGHGTHTMGTIVGGSGIGVAPASTWMACKGCATSSCYNSDLTACGQFMACPTHADGSGQDCSKAPMIVSNSWGGGGGSTWYNSVIDAWKAAGIIPVFSIGNSGPECGTAISPGDQYNLIAVGATDSADVLAQYSSLGPATGSGATRPHIVAPGSNVYSASYAGDNSFQTMSGTSMACPHVAGVAALMKSKKPSLSFNDIFMYMLGNAERSGLRAGGKNCGGLSETQFPNNALGHGRVNALKAINAF